MWKVTLSALVLSCCLLACESETAAPRDASLGGDGASLVDSGASPLDAGLERTDAGLGPDVSSRDADPIDDLGSTLDATASDASPSTDASVTDATVSPDATISPDATVSPDASGGDSGISPTGSVTTLAGTGIAGNGNGPALTAQFNEPTGVAVNAAGVVFVTERNTNGIRRIENGVVSTIVPLGLTLNDPIGIGLDVNGVLFVGDAANNCVVRIEPTSGGAAAFAGACGQRGALDGTGSSARFNRIRFLKVQADGTVWVVDGSNHAVRRIAPDGSVTTPIGTLESSGTGDGALPGTLYFPWAVLVSGSSTYVSGADQCIRVVRSGALSAFAGVCGSFGNTGDVDGVGNVARFSEPRDMVELGGLFYLADSNNSRIRTFTSSGAVSTLVGGAAGYADGDFSVARFTRPSGLAVGPDGALYLADTGNHRVRRIER